MSTPAKVVHMGSYSEVYASVMIGELILVAFEVLLLSIFKTKHLHSRETPNQESWENVKNQRSQNAFKSSEVLNSQGDQSTLLLQDAQMPLPITNLSNLFIAHGIAIAVTLSTPEHSVTLMIISLVHGAFYSATLLLTVHEKRLAYIFVLLCLLLDIAMMVICAVEKGSQISLYQAAENYFYSY